MAGLTLTFPTIALSQETTATLSGMIEDVSGSILPGATITIIHEPTGYRTGSQANEKGIFTIPNLKPGGPYTIKISYLGYKDEVLANVQLSLGNNPDMTIHLGEDANTLQELVVVANRKDPVNGLNVNEAQLKTLPSISRSLSDFTRMTPQSNNNSFAGTNFRYNNITLDGAVNNDAIGFSNSFGGVSGGGQSGTAGSGTRTNPYSMDVIQEVQVQLSPYDVKLGNFTGGSVNAVTKSGTNELHGSAYGYWHNQALVGKSPDGLKTKIGSDFHDYQYGATLSGPIIKNKLFFIANAEFTSHQDPTFYNAGDPGSISIADAERISQAFKKAGFDPGTYDRYKVFSKSEKFFARLDYNINSKHTLMLRGIYTNGRGNNLERTNTTFQFSSTDFTQYTKNLNLVGELKSRLGNNVSNNLILSYINVHDYRDFPGKTPTPFVDLTAGSTNVWLGTWREAAIYNTRQKTIELTDNVTWTKGVHKITAGTHNEFYQFNYGFINSWNGRWQYSSIDKFESNNPSRIRGTFAYDPQMNNYESLSSNAPGATYNVGLLSAYLQDEISVTNKFKITPGLRIDYAHIGKQPQKDPGINKVETPEVDNPSYTHTPFADLDNKWLGNVTVSPRLGFTYNAKGDQSLIFRGGSGIFTGRIPFAWLGYAYTLNGNDYGNIDWNNISTTVPLTEPKHLKEAVDLASGSDKNTKTRELDIIDNNFKLPTIWRSNIAMDWKFAPGFKLTLDALYTKTLYDVQFQQINLKDLSDGDGARYFAEGPKESPSYGKISGDYSSIFLLTNTKKGDRYNFTAQLSKISSGIPLGAKRALDVSASLAYTYGMSKDVSNGIRNSFGSNYEYNPAINPNNPQLGYSNFDLRHRIVAVLGTSFHWNAAQTTSLSFFYSAQSGSPYSLVYTSAPFGTGSSASLPYIPKDRNDINLADNGSYTAEQQWHDMNAFIEGDAYLKTRKGQYAERNGLRTPWNQTLDMKLMHEFKLAKSRSIQVSFDVMNLMNLLNNAWGHIYFVSNTNNYTANFLKFVPDANGTKPGIPSTGYVPTFNYLKPSGVDKQYYTVDPMNSRWQGQIGIKYNF